jgi:hypothetical protein
MDRIGPDPHQIDRRHFLRSAGAGLAAAGTVLTAQENAIAQSVAERARLVVWPRAPTRFAHCSGRGRVPDAARVADVRMPPGAVRARRPGRKAQPAGRP